MDTIISIRRSDGNSSPTVRVLHCIGRFDELPEKLVIDLDTETGEYRAIGTETQLAIIDAVEAVKVNAPRSEDEALKESDLFKEADVKRTTGQEAIAELLRQGVLRVVGQGVKGDPKRYWSPDPEKLSAATPCSSGGKNNEPTEQIGLWNVDGDPKSFLPLQSNRVTAESILEDQPRLETVVADEPVNNSNTPGIHSAATQTLIEAERKNGDVEVV